MSPASAAFLAHQTSPEAPNPSEEEVDPPEYPEPHPHSAGDLPITLALKEALVKSLEEYGVELRFFGGSWKLLVRDLKQLPGTLATWNDTIFS
ncbi:hypothetical protein D9757_005831 [Collybiopsis confluens]|uniref:Uncharacterized protein n=1 Tax=Collybiopsis confluens TaxID=2823264 RepID=A0A8H5MA76_9AGAR|nr:hypothetical protein D9757_005831 [Collybiopsis confluens]